MAKRGWRYANIRIIRYRYLSRMGRLAKLGRRSESRYCWIRFGQHGRFTELVLLDMAYCQLYRARIRTKSHVALPTRSSTRLDPQRSSCGRWLLRVGGPSRWKPIRRNIPRFSYRGCRFAISGPGIRVKLQHMASDINGTELYAESNCPLPYVDADWTSGHIGNSGSSDGYVRGERMGKWER